MKGYSDYGKIITSSAKYDSDIDDVYGCYYDLKMEKGQTIYFRVRGVDYCEIDADLDFSVCEGIRENAEHTHTYQTCVWISNKLHKMTCYCGYSINKLHVVKSGSNLCVDCGGTVGSGIVDINLATSEEKSDQEDTLNCFAENKNIYLPNNKENDFNIIVKG